MRLGRPGMPGPQIPVIPLASLALLIGTCVVVSALASASRGPGLRMASIDRDGRLDPAGALRVEVSAEQEVRVDGAPVAFDHLADELASRLAGRTDPVIVLLVSPDASYETMVAAYGAITELPGPPRIEFPWRPQGSRG